MYRTIIGAVVLAALLSSCGGAEPDLPAHQVGKTIGEFGAGVGEAALQPVREGIEARQPEWVTVSPRSKDECFEESAGVVNEAFMRCRNGWQEQVRYDEQGRKKILNDRAIPVR